MKQDGLAVAMMRLLSFWVGMIGLVVLCLPIMLCLMALFSIGGLVLSHVPFLTRLVWPGRCMVAKLVTLLQSYLYIMRLGKRVRKSSTPSVRDAVILTLTLLISMVDIVLTTWN